MSTDATRPSWGASQQLTARVVDTLERFLHIEAVSGSVLIVAGIVALVWANSPLAGAYDALWHAPLTIGFGEFTMTQTLHFFVNEALMTIFFLVAGLEIRRELHEGALSTIRTAALPVAAALGGVLAPAAFYLAFNPGPDVRQGWAVPIATDIAFAIGVLALLGRSIPGAVRVLLLALAIIDDIVAVAVIALVYSSDLNVDGALVGAIGVAIVLLFQRLGIRAAFAYVVPGVLLWLGLWRIGVHPTLAGVLLGLLTPVVPIADRSRATIFLENFASLARQAARLDERELAKSLRGVQRVERDLVPPVVTVETALHPWVAYLILPLFAFANAGVALSGTDFGVDGPRSIALGIACGLLLGKPLGIICASAVAIRLRWCELPADIGWCGLIVIALLGGIGFTMAVFIANLAYDSPEALASAKIAILFASAVSAVLALVFGRLVFGGRTQGLITAQGPVGQQGGD